MLDLHQKTIIPFLMAGYPDLKTSEDIAASLIQEGVRVLEIGVPFSDPMADGPTIQKAAAHALNRGTTLMDVFAMTKRLKNQFPHVSIVLFTYLNPLLKFGLKNYVEAAVANGVSATLTVDMPPEEAADYLSLHREAGLKTVFLASPTTAAERIPLISDSSSGFIYYISRNGVTGEQQSISKTLSSEVLKLSDVSKRAIAVGFGISTPAQAKEVAEQASAAVIGSKLLSLIDQSQNNEEAIEKVTSFIRSCFEALSSSNSDSTVSK